MTREQEQAIAIQDGTHKVLAGEMTAEDYFFYYVDTSLFASVEEYASLVYDRWQAIQ